MSKNCSCNKGFPVISEVNEKYTKSFFARHCCSHCADYLFEVELKPGMQIIATDDIANSDGKYIVPKGRLLRLSAFSEMPSCLGLIFAGLFAVGTFYPQGFAAQWDLCRIIIEGD